MIQQRLSHSVDQNLHPHQYGFRQNQSLSPLLSFSSALTEIFERHSTSLHILFLDWSQAFDSIGHPHLAAALRRCGVPPLLVQAIVALYHNGQFFVSDLPFLFPQYTFRQGIRQNYPLSPYLSIIVLL